MRHLCEVLEGLKAAILMCLIQFLYTGMNIIYKFVANDGMNMRILTVYRWILSTIFTASLAFIFERKTRPKLTKMIMWQAFLSGLFGASLAQNLYAQSLILTSATLTVAMMNLVPAATLMLAVCFGMEKLRIRTGIGKAKVLGTLLGIGGAMVLVFYKGVEIKILSTNLHLLKHHQPHPHIHNTTNHHFLGYLIAFSVCITIALWLIVQTKMSKIYPYPYSSAALMSMMGSIQCATLSLCIDRNWSQWKLGWNIRLLAVTYSGILTSGLVVILTAWGVQTRGPVFVASFSPLTLVLVAIIGSLMLDEILHLGSVIGAVLIVSGLYMVLWAQRKELKEKDKIVPTTEIVEVLTHADLSTPLPKDEHVPNHN